MREKYEGQGLEWFFRIVFALAGAAVVALVGGLLWGVWKWIS
jgi:hypothetical protein